MNEFYYSNIISERTLLYDKWKLILNNMFKKVHIKLILIDTRSCNIFKRPSAHTRLLKVRVRVRIRVITYLITYLSCVMRLGLGFITYLITYLTL